ncbi:hypothetical protein [Micromonospora sediminimaris]|uniref:Lipoprotein n=1 Tax=Micromonospora sediminimaris TaxID=547162 RepID=A0A9W5XIT7_9ACTN|nr:hypothetical protein [Micromonospora sediminimaris]GIJ32706.1 hypothetical protein Vse01_18540 [Micromonospora sediminimaris]SFD16017.1 hypothetical protein SAMN05216284_11216 [Micromonospora sediminimaris]
MRKVVSAVLTVVLALASTGCGGRSSGDPTADEDPYSESALRYGMAPVPHPDLTYQPDVVLVGGGGRSVRSVTADGLTWRIDGDASRAEDLAPGKVMFITGRGVGRVLDVQRDGGDLLVTIGPVSVTDVIRDGTLEQRGIAIENPVVYQAGEPIWAMSEEEADALGATPTGRAGRAGPLRLAPPPPRPNQPPPSRGGGEVRTVVANFSTGVSLNDGAEVSFHYHRNGTKLSGRAALTFAKPEADFHLNIKGGSVTRAELSISGGFGIRYSFEAGLRDGQNIRTVLPIPVDFSIPMGTVLGVPLALTVSQTVKVTTAFGAKVGTIKGKGEFSLAGSLGYGYANGTFGPQVSKNFKRKESLINSLTGVPVGVMGLLIEHQVRFDVGFSAFVLKAGLFFEVSTAYGTTIGSALGAPLAVCRGVGIGVRASYGVGYTILAPVVNVINKFLSLINVRPIDPSGKLGPPPYVIHSDEEVIPPGTRLCGTPKPAAD